MDYEEGVVHLLVIECEGYARLSMFFEPAAVRGRQRSLFRQVRIFKFENITRTLSVDNVPLLCRPAWQDRVCGLLILIAAQLSRLCAVLQSLAQNVRAIY